MKASKVLATFFYIIILLVVLCVIALVFVFVNNGQQNFYVQYADTKITAKAENVELPKNAVSVFYCKKLLGITDETSNVAVDDYNVTIVPNQAILKDFTFSVDGKTRQKFYGELNYTAGFNVHKYNGYFTVAFPADYTMDKYLQAIYGHSVDGLGTNLSAIKLYEEDCFFLNIECISERVTVSIGFH